MVRFQNQERRNRETEFPEAATDQAQALMECLNICTACGRRCLDEGHNQMALRCGICADICALALKLMGWQAEFHPQMLALCAQACKNCADECEKINLKACRECAESCRQCADACLPAAHSMR